MKTKSPADKLAAKKPWRRAPRNKTGYQRHATWSCNLRDVRESKRLSLLDVSKAIGISNTALWQIEKGGDPMLSTVRKIAEFYGMDVWELWPKLA
jgi:DNA-binding XRE family transcriptional regulator